MNLIIGKYLSLLKNNNNKKNKKIIINTSGKTRRLNLMNMSLKRSIFKKQLTLLLLARNAMNHLWSKL